MKGIFIMKEKLMSRLPHIYAYYSIIIFVSSIYNLLIGNTQMNISYLVELFGFLVVFFFVEPILENINFKAFWSCAVAETGLAYILFLIFAYLFKWIHFTAKEFIPASILFILIAAIGIYYINCQHRLQTRELNELIRKQKA